jgi:threonine/homoserine/homoserine lactone efflux protein
MMHGDPGPVLPDAPPAAPAPLAPVDGDGAQVVNALPTVRELVYAVYVHLTNPAFWLTAMVMLGAVVSALQKAGLSSTWAGGIIAGMAVVYTIGEAVIAARGHSAVSTVLRSTGKLGGGR